ncbi:MAG: hypothetical protein HYX48_07305 [Chlamydiales bacterium]|nr:hypothetical protein [Chlamydiales bacterium]
MRKTREDLLAEIDRTLDQLIRNAEVAEGLSFHLLEENEVEALHKTQQSLHARLIHRQELLNRKPESEDLQKKVERFGLLNERLVRQIKERFLPTGKRPMHLRKSRLSKH